MSKLYLKDHVKFEELEKLGFERSEYFGAYVRENNTGFGVIYTCVNVTNPNFGELEVHCFSSNWLDAVFKAERIMRLNQDLTENGWLEVRE